VRTEVERLRVTTPEGPGGSLAHEAGQYVFSYDGDRAAARIALSMPVRALPYVERELHPILQMNLPEGFLLEALRLRLAKLGTLDPMLLLSLTGGEHAIGRVRVTLPDAAPAKASRGESLHDMLAWDGTGDLFRLLVDRYLLRAGISGVQPKVLVPERPDEAGKATVATADLIVKSGRAEYPGLAANEYLCMSIAREAGMPVPEFFLSANRQLLVLRRFDRTASGTAIGFEDMAALMGLGAAAKYSGSYAHVARAVRLFCAEGEVEASLLHLFDQVALSCLVGNGDAHLKNFGLLYGDPAGSDCRLAPVYDMVNTTAYLPDDALALNLGGSKSFFAARLYLLDFARTCGVESPRDRIELLLAAAERVLKREQELLDAEPRVGAALRTALALFAH